MTCAVSAAAVDARAEDRLDATFSYYADTDAVTVVSPRLAGAVSIGPVTASAGASVDIISAASVDLVTAASPAGFEEVREEAGVSAAYEFGEGRAIDASFGASLEPDFFSMTAGAGVRWEVFERRAALGARYAWVRAEAGRTDDEVFSGEREQHQGELSFSPLLSEWAVADFAYGLTFVEGYQENPYRWVRLYAPGAASHATAVTESVPDERFRHAATIRLRFRAARPLFGLVEHGLYADTWGVFAQSLRARAVLALGAFTVSVDGRGYRQSAASFYRRRYATFPDVPEHRTADKELGPMWTARVGPHIEWTARLPKLEALRLGLGGDVLHMRYTDFAFLEERTAFVAGIDAVLEF